MAAVYPLDTPRYSVARLLAAYGAMMYAALVEKIKCDEVTYSASEVRAALIGLRRAGLAEQATADKRWTLTHSGKKHWRSQHARPPQVAQPTRQDACPFVCPIDQPAELYTRGMIRLSSPADRLPMVYRPGSLDSANLPRISGPYRIWPDGSRERIDGKAA